MKLELKPLAADERINKVRQMIAGGQRLGLITSIDGGQLITLMLSPETGAAECFETPVHNAEYRSMTPLVTQAHWFERIVWDMFGLYPEGHLRLKRTHLHEPYAQAATPLSATPICGLDKHEYHFLPVEGEGVYEIPVGPIHAGIIEPGHFRFSCYGDVIENLEIRLGYVHRGVEKRLTEVPWRKARFAAEAAASDMAAANALAHATAMESLLGIEVPRSVAVARTIALETERVAMHIADIGGMATDIGYLGVAATLSRLRGLALTIGDVLSGNRFFRGYITVGSVIKMPDPAQLSAAKNLLEQLSKQLPEVLDLFFENPGALERIERVGVVSHSLAEDFGLVGIGGRACGIPYDARKHFAHGIYPLSDLQVANEKGGDILSRELVRAFELKQSIPLLRSLLDELSQSDNPLPPQSLPETLPANAAAAGIVESHRGELIHLLFTDADGKVKRYCIKDASVNNWTGLAIAVRNNLVADFPLCNKSFALSYSGHDV